ncbi:Multicopper oxidase [uncultured Candidatus Thioglobus sp.]|nr:Multicopper oxidase [uncultured Candidatus Thioglobus sp.]
MISRRRFIQAGLAVLVLPKSMVYAAYKPFRNNFQVPALAQSKRVGKDVYFDLNIQSGVSRFIPNKTTKTWGINQPFLGVTLRARKGDKVHIKVNNHLKETATLHWHGMKLPAKADGGPHQPILPNKTWLSEYEIIQPAATTWYHSHQLHKTGEQVYKGLAGMFIIDDEQADALSLPSTYGVDDFPVIIQDRDFNQDGSFSYINSMHDRMMGKMGNVILVNGVRKPVLKVKKSLIRLRILNGSNARIYHLSFDDNRDFHIIASDGGLLEQTITANKITLSPAERVEVLVDVSDGKMPMLMHKPQQNSRRGMMNMMSMMGGGEESFAIFQIDATTASNTPPKLPQKLITHTKIPQKSVKKRSFELQMKMGMMRMLGNAFSINGKAMDINRIDEIVKADSTEIWTINNTSMMDHPFHIHNAQFKIIKKNNISAHETGFKDTVLVRANSAVEVLIHFPKYSDKNTPYMFHCHILEHEDQGMMGQFLVV